MHYQILKLNLFKFTQLYSICIQHLYYIIQIMLVRMRKDHILKIHYN
jgi:hypothetical protein